MKTLKINKLILLLIGLVAFNSCVEDDDFSIPNTVVVEPVFNNGEQIIPISSVAGDLAQEQGGSDLDYSDDDTLYTFPTDGNDILVEGYVISSDEGGNYFEEIILQNAPENPTIGIRVLVDVNPLFIRYEVGRKVYVKLNGLSIAISNGVLTLGPRDGERIGKIPAPQENDFIIRATEVATITPLLIDIAEFTDDKTNLFVELQNVQFSESDVLGNQPLSFASEPFDEFDGERTLISCSSGIAAIFATSTFADFKGLTLPTGRGRIKAVLQKNFFGDAFNLSINTPEDITFDDPTRCGCGLADMVGTNSIFEDNFETQSDFNLISGDGWTNYIQEGTEGWEAYTSGGSNASLGRSARVSSFSSDDVSTISWLITPAIDLDTQTGETFSFMTSNSFSDNSTLSVLFSHDWDGTEANITSATWEALADATIVSDNEPFGNWVSSGDVSLDCLSGTVHIAVVYRGNDIMGGNFNGTYELDEIKVFSN